MLHGLVLAMFCVFALRLWYLQVHKGEQFAELARDNQLRQENMYAPRGQLKDRHGRLLAIDRPSYALALVREDVQDFDKTLDQICQLTGMERGALDKKYEHGKRRVKAFEPMVLATDIPFDQVARIEANAMLWPGLEIVVRPRRFYPQGPYLAHILGYVAEANEQELEKDPGLALGDSIGKQGLELVLEKRLRGRKGLRQLEVDATGRDLGQQVLRPPVSGETIDLSIDLGLQQFAYDELMGKAGAVVVMEPFSGQLLALVTQPSYDNNAFVDGLSHTEWTALRDNPRHPLQNRVIQSVYPPGSVWKLLMAGCGLHENFIKPSDTVYCPGQYRLGRSVFRCWKEQGHGHTDLAKSLVESCDVYYYQLGERLGVDRMSQFAMACGFGKPTGVDLPHEKSGLVPTRQWKRKNRGEAWQGGDNLNMAIGQGFTLVQPLQVARYISALVNGGAILKPNLLSEAQPVELGRLPLSDVNRELIIKYMIETVESPRGTARRLQRQDAVIGGKTGTAQVVKIVGEERDKVEDMPYGTRDHAWMASFGQKNGRSYVVVVMVEHGGHGGSGAGPVVAAIYEYLFGEPGTASPQQGEAG